MNIYFKKYLKYKQKYYILKYGGRGNKLGLRLKTNAKNTLENPINKTEQNINPIIIDYLKKKKLIRFIEDNFENELATNPDICNFISKGTSGSVYLCNNKAIKLGSTRFVKSMEIYKDNNIEQIKKVLYNFIIKFKKLKKVLKDKKLLKYFVQIYDINYLIPEFTNITDYENNKDKLKSLIPPYYIIHMEYVKGITFREFILTNLDNNILIVKILYHINKVIRKLKKKNIYLNDLNMNNIIVTPISFVDASLNKFKENNVIIEQNNKYYTIKIIDLDDITIGKYKGFLTVAKSEQLPEYYNRIEKDRLAYNSFDNYLIEFCKKNNIERIIIYWKYISEKTYIEKGIKKYKDLDNLSINKSNLLIDKCIIKNMHYRDTIKELCYDEEQLKCEKENNNIDKCYNKIYKKKQKISNISLNELYIHHLLNKKSKHIVNMIFAELDNNNINIYMDRGTTNLPNNIKTIYRIMKAIYVVHNNNVLHLDIKPENFINNNGNIIIIDFGTSYLTNDINIEAELNQNHYGTTYYNTYDNMKKITNNFSIICNKYTDYWALGCTIYYIHTKKILLKESINANNEFNYIYKLLKISKNEFYTNIKNKLNRLKNKFIKNLIYNLLFKKDYDIINDLFNTYYNNQKLEDIILANTINKQIKVLKKKNKNLETGRKNNRIENYKYNNIINKIKTNNKTISSLKSILKQKYIEIIN